MSVTLKNRLPQIMAGLEPRVNVAVRAGAEVIAERAKERVPQASGDLHDAIHVEDSDEANGFHVVAGDRSPSGRLAGEVFYGHMVEFGTSHSAPEPFLIPVAEESRDEVADIVTAALRTL